MRLREPARVPEAHAFGCTSVAWVPGTTRLVTASLDETVKEWDDVPDEGPRLLHEYKGHGMGAVSVAVNATGEYAASSSLDSVVRVWSLVDHSTVAMIQADPTETWHLAFAPTHAPDGSQYLAVAGGSRGAVVLWKASREAGASFLAELQLPPPASTPGHKAMPHMPCFAMSVAISPDGSRVACGASDGSVAVWDFQTGGLLCMCEGHTKPVRSMSFMPDCNTLLTACDDMHINLHDVDAGCHVESFSAHTGRVLSVSAHPSGVAFASGGADASVKLWDIGARACVQSSDELTDQVWCVRFSDEGHRLAAVSADSSLATFAFDHLEA